jgi:O-succinylbenzoic acid--CoA ligase
MSFISVGGLQFNSENNVAMAADDPSFTANSRSAMEFCRLWLSGAEEFVMHTSGSVGKPKKVTLGRQQIKLSVQLTAKALGLKKGMNVLVCLPAGYIAGMMMLARALELDMNATVVEPSGNPLESIPEDHDLDFVSLVPLQLRRILESETGRIRLNRFKKVLIGGAPLSSDLEKEIVSLQPEVYHTYGMTETASHIALRPLNGPNASPYFYPLEGVEISLDDRGCLLIRGAITRGEVLATNDLAEIKGRGFRISGRIDNIINSGGIKVQIERVEKAIEEVLGGNVPFFVSSLPDAVLGEKVVAVFESSGADKGFEEELKMKLGLLLSRFEIPGAILKVAEFVYTSSGKINRKATMELSGNP